MMKLNFDMPTDAETHVCESHRDGDWIYFRCPKCPEYERKLNWKTGELKTKNAQAHINHTGSYAPNEFRDAFLNVN